MTDLIALAERVEAAAGPDRALNAEIAIATGRFFLAEPRYPGAVRMYGYIDEDGSRVEPGNGSQDRLIPTYSASLDAAMKLVPERAWLRMDAWPRDFCAPVATICPLIEEKDNPTYTATGSTFPLALTAACLKALATIRKEQGA